MYLAIERNEDLHNRQVQTWLSRDISPVRVNSMAEGIEKAICNKFLFIVINADNINYLAELRILRDVTNDPILIATNSYTTQEQRRAMELGADFFGQVNDNPNDNYKTVMAVINRLSDRVNQQKKIANVITYGDILIALDYYRVFIGDNKITLSKTEINILYYLISTPGRVLSHEQIYHYVWDYNYDYDESVYEVIKSAIKRLRKKISDAGYNGNIIENVKGVGFRVSMTPDAV